MSQDPFASIDQRLSAILDKRREKDQLRQLLVLEGIDFCSNDYLGLARDPELKQQWKEIIAASEDKLGATGSRSISGHTRLARELEEEIAAYHQAETGLLFNSGYDANVGLFSSLPGRQDHLVCDELIHASIIDGCRLSYATRHRFAHNDTRSLEEKLQSLQGSRSPGSMVFVVVESVYSMDGDQAPLQEIVSLCEQYEALLIVDEAHATGVYGPEGRGMVVAEGLADRVWARIHTFGKALGTHGAIVLGSGRLKDYLLNHARSFIFTTALPPHALLAIRLAYQALGQAGPRIEVLQERIGYFKEKIKPVEGTWFIPSASAVQSLVIPGSRRAAQWGKTLGEKGFAVKAIQHPSVAEGKERIRFSIHYHNRPEEIDLLSRVFS